MHGEQRYHDPARGGRRNSSRTRGFTVFLWPVLTLLFCMAGHADALIWQSDLIFLNTTFENGSPLYWEADANNVVNVYLVYDQERASPNRANGHWFFQVQAKPGAELTFVLHNFDNVWNGQKGSPIDKRTVGFVSEDGRNWQAFSAEKTADNFLRFKVRVDKGTLYLARLPPYRLSDLEALKRRIRDDRRVEIVAIGETVEGRELEIIRVGNPDATHRVLLRARAHPWEPGGNWVVEGLIQRLLRDDADAKRYLDAYCVYIMPMANKDGVARGRTRFNQLGSDLNRKWDKPADPAVNPENHALETWLASMIAKGQKPDLMIDLHNDESGGLHVDRPSKGLDDYLGSMNRLEAVLRKYTWYTERCSRATSSSPGVIGEGLLDRFGVHACVLELNANWIAGLNAYTSAERWKLFGEQLCEAFSHYFEVKTTP
ncbi:MAG: peptidase M14 [Planctomycetes bacterium]|nr:peptidase M14 [Planctomycetota bacterium]